MACLGWLRPGVRRLSRCTASERMIDSKIGFGVVMAVRTATLDVLCIWLAKDVSKLMGDDAVRLRF